MNLGSTLVDNITCSYFDSIRRVQDIDHVFLKYQNKRISVLEVFQPVWSTITSCEIDAS